MDFAPTTYYIVDVTTADKLELMAALAGLHKTLVINGFDKRAI